MADPTTVVFADLTGSTALFESIGNEKATEAVTRLTQWIGEIFSVNAGRMVKKLGDGVLGIFPNAEDAVGAMVDMQRGHQRRLQRWPQALRTEIRVGVAFGDIMEVDGDCYGDAVNLASRICDIAGASQILVDDSVVQQIPNASNLRFRKLGPINVRGRSEAPVLHQVEWAEEVSSDLLTLEGDLSHLPVDDEGGTGRIELSWLDERRIFSSLDLPVHLGRVNEAELQINDPRVSRLHARLDWRHGSFVLTDLSSFGTWVRFAGSDSEAQLRREECLLHGSGEIGLGVPFADVSAPTVQFSIEASHPPGG